MICHIKQAVKRLLLFKLILRLLYTYLHKLKHTNCMLSTSYPRNFPKLVDNTLLCEQKIML
jgi:hypothetical protein